MTMNHFSCFCNSGAGTTSAPGSGITATFYASTFSLFFSTPSLFIGCKPVGVSQIKCLSNCEGCRLGLHLKILVLSFVCFWMRSDLCIAEILNQLFYDNPN